MEQKLKIAVFIDFDNIEIGVKSTLHREFDVAAVLDALKERGEIVTKFAYANWGRQESATRALSEHAVQMCSATLHRVATKMAPTSTWPWTRSKWRSPM